MKAGDVIIVDSYCPHTGAKDGEDELTIEEYRHTLGVFMREETREAGDFTPLCELYMKGPDTEEAYCCNHGPYFTNMVPYFRLKSGEE